MVVVGCLDKKNQAEVMEDYPAVSIPKEQRPKAIDSHFHLDRVRNKLGHQVDYKQMLESVVPEIGAEVWVTGGVAVFCDPPTYPTQAEVTELVEQGVGVAIGLHPKPLKSYTEDDFKKFTKCIKYTGVCALGEVGLDHYQTKPDTWDDQHHLLDQALEHLTVDKVLVLHNRGDGNEMMELLYHLKGVVPRTQRIHLHCFNGSVKSRDKWINQFPNIHFGFTALVDHFRKPQKEALRTLEANRLLLETDAPYFHIGNNHLSTPALLGTTAQIVARVRGETWQQVLEVSAVNAQKLYRLPST